MKKFIRKIAATLTLALSFAAVAQAQPTSRGVAQNISALPTLGSLGVDLAPLNVAVVHKIEGAEAVRVAAKFNIKASDNVAVIGIDYTATDTEGTVTKGFYWVKVIPNPTAESVRAALGGLSSADMKGLSQELMERAKSKAEVTQPMQGQVQGQTGASSGQGPVKVKKSGAPLEVVVIGATWCHYCVNLKAIVARIKPQYKGRVIFTEYDQDQRPDMVKKYGARNTPTVIYLRDGKEVQRSPGSPGEGLIRIIDYLLD